MKLTLTKLDNFIKKELPKDLRDEYLNYKILSEADLQSFAWNYISSFIEKNHKNTTDFKVLNKPYLKKLKIHPDIIIFRKKTPWVIIELKESKKLKLQSAQRERERLLKVKQHFGKSVKRGYLLFITRYGEGKIIKGPKGDGAKYFFEVRISLEEYLPDSKIKTWEPEFKMWAKYS